jgi:hypothetical protein
MIDMAGKYNPLHGLLSNGMLTNLLTLNLEDLMAQPGRVDENLLRARNIDISEMDVIC